MYSSSEYVDMILTFARCGNNAREAVRLYRDNFHKDKKTRQINRSGSRNESDAASSKKKLGVLQEM
jgi:predicted 3-demethylubiquinone-9 3-methyltransferase (glyoxalase superfamily)